MRALVLSGGGDRGAFQVGVIKRLVELGHRWEMIAGVSVGAINATQMAMYSPADQHLGALKLEDFWFSLQGQKSIYAPWFGGPIAALLGRGSFNSTAPLEKFLRDRFDLKRLRGSGVKLMVGTVSLKTGEYRLISGQAGDPIKWVMASAAFPAAFPPISIDDDLWVDGGIRNCTPISDALNAGASEVDVVVANPRTGATIPWDVRQAGSALNVGMRAAEIMADEVFVRDLNAALHATVSVRIYAPLTPWTRSALEFDPDNIRHMIDVGYGIP